ncbi:MAG: UDP-N-acetylmuramoyl-tripeptide--D-alanyl-D-alanine ligase [Anaerohalosphaeraceae bacterium]|nr:UDP-N-acetylmuramoyl-tripeptide--D-alanyl-D-alanine ligase [Anaerohalosphaeraceae bacterium]
MKITIQQLAQCLGVNIDKNQQAEITGASIDSRTIKKGDIFFALKGQNFDGADFLAQAFENGAVCAVVEKDISEKFPLPLIRTKSVIESLGESANYIRKKSNFKLIAITGSAGKTTTRNIIYHILSKNFKCCQSPKNFNNNIGLPLTILNAPENTQIVIAELGSSTPGEIAQLTKIATPDIAVITNICPAHLQGFGNIEAIIAEKASIAKGLRPGGKFIINGQSAGLRDYCRQNGFEFSTFGDSKDCDTFAANIKTQAFSSSFKIDSQLVTLPLIGSANVENAIAAWTVCKNFGITPQQFSDDITSVRPVDMRLVPLTIGKAVILDDCYNANPASMLNAINTLTAIGKAKKARTVFICGKMGELAGQSVGYHRELGQKCALLKIDVLLSTKGDAAEIVTSAREHANYEITAEVFENTGQLCNNLHKFLQPDDIILIKASRSERFESVSREIKKIIKG